MTAVSAAPRTAGLVVTLFALARLPAAAAAPTFDVTVTPTLLEVTGNTGAAVEEAVYRHAATAFAPDRQHRIELQHDPSAPVGWGLIAELSLRAATLLEHGSVAVSTKAVSIRGATRYPRRMKSLLPRLEAVMLPGMSLSESVVAISGSEESFDDICVRRFAELTGEAAEDLVDDTGGLRSALEPVFDRVAELMFDCPQLRVRILNRPTEPERAAAVRRYLQSRGIAGNRLESGSATGAGDADVVNGTQALIATF